MARGDDQQVANRSEELERQYQMRFEGNEAYRDDIWKTLCGDFFGGYIPRNASVLDLGAGWGEFINNIEAGEKYAMDLNAASVEHLAPGIRFMQQDCSQPWAMEEGCLDVVFASNFFEHLPDKRHIERTVAEAYRCLKNDGLLICMSPNMNCVPGAYWDFWDHHVPLTELSFAELLKMNGFAIERSVRRFIPYTMTTGFRPPVLFVRIYLHLPFIWPLFGEQFLVVGRKIAIDAGKEHT
jgi:SAM-dependent methyltransferase